MTGTPPVPTVLVIDDEPQMRRTLDTNLRARGYNVALAADGASALTIAGRVRPDVVILDLGLPDIDGLEVLDGLRGWSAVPIIVLSARDNEKAKVAALNAGADDFVAKPFGIDELVARLRAAMRRTTSGQVDEAVIETPDFSIDLANKMVLDRTGASVHLTRKQWQIVEMLSRNAGRLITYPQLLRQVWGPGYETETNYTRVFMAQIRQKLEPDPTQPRYFLTETGTGFRFVVPTSSDLQRTSNTTDTPSCELPPISRTP
jgi:two-component system KDP operon response regulator KdpE